MDQFHSQFGISHSKLKSFFLGLLLALAALVDHAAADQLLLTSSLGMKEEYNDNIFFSESRETDDFITTVSPGLEVVKRTARLDTGLGVRLDGIVYADNSDLDAVDQDYTGSLRYQLTSRLRVSTDLNHARDSRPDRDLLTTGLVQSTATRIRQHYAAGGEYALTEKNSAALSYVFDRDDFDAAGFVDYNRHSASLGFTRTFAPLATGHANFSFSRFDYDRLQVDTSTLTMGAERELSEKWRVAADLGPRYSHFDFKTDGSSGDSTGVIGSLTLRYQGIGSSGRLAFSREIGAAASDLEGTVERTSLLLGLTKRFTEEVHASLDGGYHWNRSDRRELAFGDVDQETVFVHPSLRYQFNREIAAEASYRYTVVTDDERQTESHRNTVIVRLLIEYPFKE